MALMTVKRHEMPRYADYLMLCRSSSGVRNPSRIRVIRRDPGRAKSFWTGLGICLDTRPEPAANHVEVADCGTDCVTTRPKKNMVHPAWLEHATFGFVDQRSIQLSYGCRQDGKQFKVSGFRFQVSVAVGRWV